MNGLLAGALLSGMGKLADTSYDEAIKLEAGANKSRADLMKDLMVERIKGQNSVATEQAKRSPLSLGNDAVSERVALASGLSLPEIQAARQYARNGGALSDEASTAMARAWNRITSAINALDKDTSQASENAANAGKTNFVTSLGKRAAANANDRSAVAETMAAMNGQPLYGIGGNSVLQRYNGSINPLPINPGSDQGVNNARLLRDVAEGKIRQATQLRQTLEKDFGMTDAQRQSAMNNITALEDEANKLMAQVVGMASRRGSSRGDVGMFLER